MEKMQQLMVELGMKKVETAHVMSTGLSHLALLFVIVRCYDRFVLRTGKGGSLTQILGKPQLGKARPAFLQSPKSMLLLAAAELPAAGRPFSRGGLHRDCQHAEGHL